MTFNTVPLRRKTSFHFFYIFFAILAVKSSFAFIANICNLSHLRKWECTEENTKYFSNKFKGVDMEQDGNGHFYFEIDNVRVTYVPAVDRTEENNWANSDVIRIQAYRSTENKSLHLGAELPINSPEMLIALIGGLCNLYSQVTSEE
ncbi:MAG: hypothetical protein LWX07_13155 [Bacteroidetes bacterium]|nr:hypothetical protein [Bacteroidota bacterium]